MGALFVPGYQQKKETTNLGAPPCCASCFPPDLDEAHGQCLHESMRVFKATLRLVEAETNRKERICSLCREKPKSNAHLLQKLLIFPVGFKGKLSLVDMLCLILSRGRKRQMLLESKTGFLSKCVEGVCFLRGGGRCLGDWGLGLGVGGWGAGGWGFGGGVVVGGGVVGGGGGGFVQKLASFEPDLADAVLVWAPSPGEEQRPRARPQRAEGEANPRFCRGLFIRGQH